MCAEGLGRGGDSAFASPSGGGGAPLSTITERTPPAKRTLPATIKERAMRTRDPRSGGAQGLDGRYNSRRSGAPGPHAHGNAARQVVDDRRAEVRGQQKQSKRPPQQPAQPPVRQLLGTADAQTAHPAASSTAPAHQLLGSANAKNDTSRSTGRSGRQNAATRRNMRREERVTVQGPVTKEQCHKGGGGGGAAWVPCAAPGVQCHVCSVPLFCWGRVRVSPEGTGGGGVMQV